MFILGYPCDVGGAGTELWSVVRMWRRAGVEVDLVPTWKTNPAYEARLSALGCRTHYSASQWLDRVPGLPGSIVHGWCNEHFVRALPALRALGCRTVWTNCMTHAFAHEKDTFKRSPPDALCYHTEFQAGELRRAWARMRWTPSREVVMKAPLDLETFDYEPLSRPAGEPFVVGKIARAAGDKWPARLWRALESMKISDMRAVVMGIDRPMLRRVRPPPAWATALPPASIPTREFYRRLHCMIPLNGESRENWPRAGLEAMACGVPVVAPRRWGWPEMIEHGVSGFLFDDEREMGACARVLADDEDLRLTIARQARTRVEVLTDERAIMRGWEALWTSL